MPRAGEVRERKHAARTKFVVTREVRERKHSAETGEVHYLFSPANHFCFEMHLSTHDDPLPKYIGKAMS